MGGVGFNVIIVLKINGRYCKYYLGVFESVLGEVEVIYSFGGGRGRGVG